MLYLNDLGQVLQDSCFLFIHGCHTKYLLPSSRQKIKIKEVKNPNQTKIKQRFSEFILFSIETGPKKGNLPVKADRSSRKGGGDNNRKQKELHGPSGLHLTSYWFYNSAFISMNS